MRVRGTVCVCVCVWLTFLHLNGIEVLHLPHCDSGKLASVVAEDITIIQIRSSQNLSNTKNMTDHVISTFIDT